MGERTVQVQEILEIKNTRMNGDGTMSGFTRILGLSMHVSFIRVRTNENHIQVADGCSLAHDLYEDLCKLDHRGPFETMRLEDFDGEWVMFLHPFSRG